MSNLSAGSFLRFLLVGGGATLLQYLIMAGLVYGFAMEAVLASGIGYVLSAAFNYWASARYTFRSDNSHRQGIPRFVVMLAAGCVINMLVLYGLRRLNVPLWLAQLLTTGVVFIWNYMVSAAWTFRKETK